MSPAAAQSSERPLPANGVFEIGLVLAGAVSAGAYTAGVLDFFVEALDQWESAKKEHRCPQHKVVLRVVTATSAGAILGATLAAALNRKFPPIRQNSTAEDRKANPFYRMWVDELNLEGFLDCGDLASGDTALALGNSEFLGGLVKKSVAGLEHLERVEPRSYVADPLRLVLTTTNLRGVPFRLPYRGPAPGDQPEGDATNPYWMQNAADAVRFAIKGMGKAEHNDEPAIGPETVIPGEPVEHPMLWKAVVNAALASGAFPVAVSPQLIDKSTTDYFHRPVAVPNDDGKMEVQHISPALVRGRPYPAMCVDGGVLSLKPQEQARVELVGSLLGRNARDGQEAKRAVILIDPLQERPAEGPASPEGLNFIRVGLYLINTWLTQPKFCPEDIALADDVTIYSRYLLTPDRGAGRIHSACGGLFGFLGFLDKGLRKHDFFLGRRNCQEFLRQHFSLPERNGLFNSWDVGDAPTPRTHAVEAFAAVWRTRHPRGGDAPRELPIIPLFGPCDEILEALPAWPAKTKIRLGKFNAGLSARLNAIYRSLDLGWLRLIASPFWYLLGNCLLRRKIFAILKQALRNHLWAGEWVHGVVLRVDEELGEVTIEQEELSTLHLPGLHVAYAARELDLLKHLKPGRKVRFQATGLDGDNPCLLAIEPDSGA